jgi:serine/threonine-protein kinase
MGAPVVEGQILAGKYRVERVIGKGGMGVVVAATHRYLRQPVAIKLLTGDATPEAVKRFLREARSAARLRGEHVARVLDAGALETGAPYMVIEHLEGDDLSKTVRQRRALAIAEAVDYVLQACEAVAEAHHLGIIHRDLKPSNLFVATAMDGTKMIKVLDFGISKSAEPSGTKSQTLTQTDETLGSPLYMAPEQMKSARQVDVRADIWSTGVILYQLLTAHLPFEASSLEELVLMMINDEPPLPPRSHRPDLPEPLESAILRCLAKDRALRFANIGELAQAIGPYGSEDAARSVAKIQRLLGRPPDLGTDSGRLDVAAPSSRDGASYQAPLSDRGAPASYPSGLLVVPHATQTNEEKRARDASLSGSTLKAWAVKARATVGSRQPSWVKMAVVAAVVAITVLAVAALCARHRGQQATWCAYK